MDVRRRKRKICMVKAMIWITAFLLAVVLIDMQMRPSVETMAAYQARLYAVRAINDAIAQELAEENVTYDTLVKVSTGEDGLVTAVETDMLRLNRIKVGVTEEVVKELGELEAAHLKVPLGTLFGGQIFSGRGPLVDFRIIHAGYVETEIQNRFDAAGINQTRHQIMLSVTIHITALVPGYTADTDVTTNICLAETIIVGMVPDAYTKVTGDDDSTLHKINDYGARASLGSGAVSPN